MSFKTCSISALGKLIFFEFYFKRFMCAFDRYTSYILLTNIEKFLAINFPNGLLDQMI